MLMPGTTLQNRYHVVRWIGGGGMGEVYLAEDARLTGRQCAIKAMSPAQLAPRERSWAISAFKQEAQMLARLSHVGLAAVTDFFSEGGSWYLVMDFVHGETLEQRLSRAPRGCLSLDEALNITRQLCNVLEYLHGQSRPVIFRDLKPGNVMLTSEGGVKLIDFGIARFFKKGQTQDTVSLGTPGYAAPEQFGGLGQSDPRTDVYSLGALLHHMVTGHDPTTAAAPFPLPDPGSLVRGLPIHVEAVISRATQLQPDRRYSNVGELRRALFPPTHPLPPQPRPPPQARPVPGPGSAVWIVLSIAGVMVLGLCIASAVGAVSLVDLLPCGDDTPTRRSASPPARTPTALAGVPPTGATEPAPTPASPRDGVSSAPTALLSSLIAYVQGGVGNTDVYVAHADGSSHDCVSCRACDEAEPAWAPDGTRVVYQADCGSSYDIWSTDIASGRTTQLTDTPGLDEREPAWSPDGSRIVYRVSDVESDRNADGVLWVMSATGSDQERLGGASIRGRSPSWSPDGQRVVFMSQRSGRWQVYIYDVGTGSTTRLTNCRTNCRWPCWSPDGRYVAYHSTVSAAGADSATAETIWIVPAVGGTATQLVTGSHAGRPSWSFSDQIAFNSDRGIEVVAADGSDRRLLISGSSNWAPCWSE